jgi:hypothetical protein
LGKARYDGGESMGLDENRLRRARGIAVIGLICAVSAFAATSASAATWTGTTHGKILRSTRLVSGGTTWEGDFWFRTSRRGAVRGQAVVAYEPSIDVSGLNNALNYIKSVAGVPLGLLGPYGGFVNTVGLGQIVGTNVSFQAAKAVHRGPLSGTLRRGRLTLRWNARLPGIPYDLYFQLVNRSERIGGGRFAVRNPFLRGDGAGDVENGRHAVNTSQSRTQDGDVTQTVGSYWVAHRER